MFSIYSCEFCLCITSDKSRRKTVIVVYMETFVVKLKGSQVCWKSLKSVEKRCLVK